MMTPRSISIKMQNDAHAMLTERGSPGTIRSAAPSPAIKAPSTTKGTANALCQAMERSVGDWNCCRARQDDEPQKKPRSEDATSGDDQVDGKKILLGVAVTC